MGFEANIFRVEAYTVVEADIYGRIHLEHADDAAAGVLDRHGIVKITIICMYIYLHTYTYTYVCIYIYIYTYIYI